jgi:hypothetical protein
VLYASDIVGSKAADDLPAGADYPHVACVATEEQIGRSCTDARYLIALEYASGFVVGELDLVDVEEVERLPLLRQPVSAANTCCSE